MIKLKLIFILSIIASSSFGQVEGQSFCDGNAKGDYFPLEIEKKKIEYGNTFYTETRKEQVKIGEQNYYIFEQKWENNAVDTIYLRESNGTIFQYDQQWKAETIRYSQNFKKGEKWKSSQGDIEYSVHSYSGKLKTPFCNYKNLLVIKSESKARVYYFYYLKGYGYIGTRKNNKLAASVSPYL